MSTHPFLFTRRVGVASLLAAAVLLVPGCTDRSVTEPDEFDLLAKPKPPGPQVQSRIAFASSRDGDWEIYTMNADGTTQERLTYSYYFNDDQPALSPNGQRIAFSSTRDEWQRDIYVMNADGSGQARLTTDPMNEQEPAWSPDGRQIAFVRQVQVTPEVSWQQLFVMDADGSHQRCVISDPDAFRPSWSPDGRRIVFSSHYAGVENREIFVVNVDGSGLTQLTDNDADDFAPSWSPSGSQIAFASYRGDNADIYVMNADGAGETRITEHPSKDERPGWSPDGSQIVFNSDRTGHGEIWVMNADGSGLYQLTNSGLTPGGSQPNNLWPSWSEVRPDEGEIAEALIGNSYLAWWSATQWNNGIPMALSVAAEELTSSWRNFGMEDLSTEPREAFDNRPSYTYASVNAFPWFHSYVALSSVYDGIRLIQKGAEVGGPGGPGNARALAFAKFVQGVTHGWLALVFDQAFVLDETVHIEKDDLVLKPYPEVMAAAMSELEAAIAIADANTFTLPDHWINGLPLTNVELSRLAHSYLARIMTQVARTPAERTAVNWSAVIAHVDAGIQQDLAIRSDERWVDELKQYGMQTGWTRVDYKTIGWLDTSGNFAAWLATPVADRNEIEIVTPDARVTGPGDPPDGSDFRNTGPSPFYVDRGTYHFSFYTHRRWAESLYGVGTLVHMTTSEMQLIKAEGLLRTAGPSQQVADIINATRVGRGQLEPALGSEPAADVMDKLIYEKRIEGFLLCGGCAFFDRRGFGPLAPTGPEFHHGLVEGTPLHLPVPGIVLERLGLPYYTFGGVGNEMGSVGVAAAVQAVPVSARDIYRFDPEMTAAEKLSSVERELAGASSGPREQARRQ